MNFGLTGFAGRLAQAIFYGIVVFLVVYILGILLQQLTPLGEIGDLLKKWAAILGILAGIAAFFTGNRTV